MMSMATKRIDPWVRVAIMVAGVTAVASLSRYFTGSLLPTTPREALVFQNALLLIVLGSALLEHHYTKPADSVVNALMGVITLITVYSEAPRVAWLVVATYCGVVFLVSSTCVAVSSSKEVGGWRKRVADITYRPAVVFGRSRVLFSIVFISGLWFFYSVKEPITIALVLFWGIFVVLWPLRVPELITAWLGRGGQPSTSRGAIVRMDDPNVLRVALHAESEWETGGPQVCVLPDGRAKWVQPLFAQFQEGRLLATGLLTDLDAPYSGPDRNCVVRPVSATDIPTEAALTAALSGGEGASLLGFVVENSNVGEVHFETLHHADCHEGMLVWANIEEKRIYYQITDGETREESFAADKHGYRAARAAQLGVLKRGAGFAKYDWLPPMNTPIFGSVEGGTVSDEAVVDGDFLFGTIPNSDIRVGGDFAGTFNSHTAVLGVTGSGKTELAFDMIRHALQKEMRVVCIDLTAQYEDRLSNLQPHNLSVDADTAKDLGDKLFDVETGEYGGYKEKKPLKEFADKIREEVSNSVKSFLEEEGGGLGLIQLDEISNTKATLWITEIYMTCILKYARENPDTRRPTLVVVEEAHTVMPEASAMGLGDFDSKGLVAKISQIALQGRKYDVGLLVIAQRTATVSKTILTQCNTIVSFSCYDATSLNFLRNIFGAEHVRLLPNLPRLHAIAFGPGVRAERPVVFEVPFDDAKASGARFGTALGDVEVDAPSEEE